ncbi:hypothetical protein FG386_001008 [Cryptosporidium ryanae]|uniref:uncharacterized protein n=1 Tax=Cryptosporidium ryanae TaxID=515981 RepID=UPI00351A356E|nr:hypothetical protein FG386_001008 [Cryptosporidium ryanae]
MENENETKPSNDSSLIIDSLRNQIKKIPKFNKYRVLKSGIENESQLNCERNSSNTENNANDSNKQITSVAEQMRNTVLTCYSSVKESDYGEYVKNDVFSPFRKRQRNIENTYFRDKILNYFRLKTDENELCLYRINKLRGEMIKLRRKSENGDDRCGQFNAINFIPSVYTPLSPIKLLSIKELTLLLSIFYSNDAEKSFLSYYFNDSNREENDRIAFLYVERLSITRYSTVITGKITHKLDGNFLFSHHNSHPCKFVLNHSKWIKTSNIISTNPGELSSNVFIIVNPEIVKSCGVSYISSEHKHAKDPNPIMDVDSDASSEEFETLDEEQIIVLPADEIEEREGDEYMNEDEEEDIPFFNVIDESSGTLIEIDSPVCCIDVDPVRRGYVLFGGCDDKAYISNLPTKTIGGEERVNIGYINVFEGHLDTVSCVSYSKDGRYFATAGCEGTVRIYGNENNNYGALLNVLEGPSDELEYITWHPKGPCLLCGGLDTTSWLWMLPEGNVLSVLSGHSDSVTCGDFTNDGRLVCTGSLDGSVIIWNPKNGASVHKISKKNLVESVVIDKESILNDNIGVVSLKCHRETPIVAVGLTNGLFSLIQTETGKILSSNLEHCDSLNCLEFNHTSSDPLIATGDMSGELKIWNYEHNRINFAMKHEEFEHSNGVLPGITGICWGGGRRGNTLITTGCLDGTIRVWDYRSGENVKTLRGHKSGVMSIKVIEPDSNDISGFSDSDHILRVVSGGDDGRCLLWDIRK